MIAQLLYFAARVYRDEPAYERDDNWKGWLDAWLKQGRVKGLWTVGVEVRGARNHGERKQYLS